VNHINPAPLQEIVERWVSGHTAAVADKVLRFRDRVEERMQSAEIRDIIVEVQIKAAPERVWAALIEELSEWWPRDCLSLKGAEMILFEPWAGGRLYETAPDGGQLMWANVVMIQPGKAIEFVGYMTPTYSGPSITMYRFAIEATPDGQTIFRVGDSVMGRIDNAQEANLKEGWSYLANAFRKHVEAGAAQL
jgi:uncharacterized protein YndB with AHSA1/START domain